MTVAPVPSGGGPSGYLVFAVREAHGGYWPVIVGYRTVVGRDSAHHTHRCHAESQNKAWLATWVRSKGEAERWIDQTLREHARPVFELEPTR